MGNLKCQLLPESRSHPQQRLVGYRYHLSQCFTGKARKVEGCTTCGSIKDETTECPRKITKRPASENIKAPSPKQPKQKPHVCFNWNYKCSCHLNPCPYKHECTKYSPEDHQFLHCPNNSKRRDPRSRSGHTVPLLTTAILSS